MSTNAHYDVIVIGGGASGMMAAGRAASRGRKVLLIEKNKDLGKKLSITGGGRCNILNAEPDTRKLLENYGDAGKYLHSPFSQHTMQDSWDFFESRGLPIVVQARKRAFPETEDAKDVTAVMRRYVNEHHVELKTKTRAEELLCDGNIITAVRTNNGTYSAKQFVLATGGSSHQETGSTGEGLEWLGELGYTIHAPNPDIVPLKVEEEWPKRLSGTTLSFMKITFGANFPKTEGRFSRTGKILFTHFGISGPLVLNAAHDVKQLLHKGPVRSTIDMFPDTELGTVRNRLLALFEQNKNKALKNVLPEIAPAGMTEGVLAQIDPSLHEEKVHNIIKEVRNHIADRLKAMPLSINGTMGLDWAVISDGGVDLTEVDTKTMRSKLHTNLSFTGDVLNINRPSGGFSLQLCWTTGWVAGSHV